MGPRTRVAAIYDIHGNLPALEAVLDDIDRARVDEVVVGGDVLPGPIVREVLDRLSSLEMPVQFIRGNGDRETVALRRGEKTTVPPPYLDAMRWVAGELRAADEQTIASWPTTVRVEVAALGSVLFCHATPQSDTPIFTRLTSADRVTAFFAGIDAALVVCGHTHMQFDRTVGRLRIVNAGSVGMPFGAPGAYWVLLGPDVQLRRTSYDLELAAERIRRTAYPQAQQFADGHILRPPSEEQMLQLFAQAEQA
jgi:putative phosphoesterase